MIYIIKSQLSYIKQMNFVSIITIHVAVISYSYFREFNPFNLVCFFLFTQYLATVVLINSAEKRDYIFKLTSLTNKEIALSRIILSFIGFVILYSLALFLHLTFFNNPAEFKDSLHELFMFGGLCLCGIFFYLSIHDSFASLKTKSGLVWFNIIIGLVIGILAFGVIIGVEKSYSDSVTSSIALLTLIYVSSLGLAFLSYKTYQIRESYLGV